MHKYKAKVVFTVEKEWEINADDREKAIEKMDDLINAIEVIYGGEMTYSELEETK